MSRIQFNDALSLIGIIHVTVTIDSNGESTEKDIEELRKSLDISSRILYLHSNNKYLITDRVFDKCHCKRLHLKNVVLSRKAAASIPASIIHLTTNCNQPYIDEITVSELDISTKCKEITIPQAVKHLTVRESENITIKCSDNLETINFSSPNAIATLENCNNLSMLHIEHVNSRVYGDFMNYFGCISLSHKPLSQDICEYLSMFKKLHIYSGYIDRNILKSLPNVTRVRSTNESIKLNIDDIPDSLEDMNFNVVGLSSSDILAKKPNITKIAHSEAEMDAIFLIELYPNVYFYRPGDEDLVRNNKKLLKLEDLTRESMSTPDPLIDSTGCTIL